MKRIRRALAVLALVVGVSLTATAQPSAAYYETGDVLVWGSGGRSCWLRLTYAQNVLNQPIAQQNYLSQCTVATPMNHQVLVNFGQWPWAVASNPTSINTNPIFAVLNQSGVEADGACGRVQWWDGEWSNWGCISMWT